MRFNEGVDGRNCLGKFDINYQIINYLVDWMGTEDEVSLWNSIVVDTVIIRSSVRYENLRLTFTASI